jgi:hypothetical protein
MKTQLTKTEQIMLEKLERGGIELIKKYPLIWCYLDGKINGCKTFDERTEQFSKEMRLDYLKNKK